MTELQISQSDLSVMVTITDAEPPGGLYDVAWGDGTSESGTTHSGTIEITHRYSESGTYIIQLEQRSGKWEFTEQVDVFEPGGPPPGDEHVQFVFTHHRPVTAPSGAYFVGHPQLPVTMTGSDAEALAAAGNGYIASPPISPPSPSVAGDTGSDEE